MSMFVKVAKTHDLAEGGMVAVLVGDTEILLAQVQGQYYAMSNVCSHAWEHSSLESMYVNASR
jgi:nitrite reductase/ring-hydroxylating ferredoxin subunit